MTPHVVMGKQFTAGWCDTVWHEALPGAAAQEALSTHSPALFTSGEIKCLLWFEYQSQNISVYQVYWFH